MKSVVDGKDTSVWKGRSTCGVYDRHVIADHPTIRMRTRRGLIVEGSNNHRVLLPDRETWCRLDALSLGDRVAVSGGNGLWPEHEVGLEWEPRRRITLSEVADWAQAPNWAVADYRRGRNVRNRAALAYALQFYDAAPNQTLWVQPHLPPQRVLSPRRV